MIAINKALAPAPLGHVDVPQRMITNTVIGLSNRTPHAAFACEAAYVFFCFNASDEIVKIAKSEIRRSSESYG